MTVRKTGTHASDTTIWGPSVADSSNSSIVESFPVKAVNRIANDNNPSGYISAHGGHIAWHILKSSHSCSSSSFVTDEDLRGRNVLLLTSFCYVNSLDTLEKVHCSWAHWKVMAAVLIVLTSDQSYSSQPFILQGHMCAQEAIGLDAVSTARSYLRNLKLH